MKLNWLNDCLMKIDWIELNLICLIDWLNYICLFDWIVIVLLIEWIDDVDECCDEFDFWEVVCLSE